MATTAVAEGFEAGADIDVVGTKADAVHCETLRISYKDPCSAIAERLTEDVFLDPRDSWCGPGGLLFVTASALTALQQSLDKRYNYFRGTQETIDLCRHDYMRELQYLVEELQSMRRLGREAGRDKRDMDSIEALLYRVQEQRIEVDSESIAALDQDEVAELASSAGPHEESDEELIQHLEQAGLGRKCELTLRILLKLMHTSTDDLVLERDRLLVILGPLDGEKGAEKIIDALLAAAKGEGATISDLILAVQDYMRTDETRQEVEDLVTDKLRQRYTALEKQYSELVPKLERWRVTLAESEQREAQIFYLNEEAVSLAEQVQQRQELEEAKIEAWKAKNDPEKKKLLIQMKAMDSSNLSTEDAGKLKSMQLAEANCQKDCDEMNEAILKCEADLENYASRKAALEEQFPDLERDNRFAEKDMMRAEEKLEEAEVLEKTLVNQEESVKKQREMLEDEYAAAQAPPPKNSELIKLEEQVEAARERNAALRVVEEGIYERERRYEGLCATAEAAWKEEEDAKCAATKRQKEEESSVAVRASTPAERQLLEDPMLMPYYQRIAIPEVATIPRFVNMHTDMRARERQLQKRIREHLAVEAEKIFASAEAVGVTGAGSAAATQAQSHVPPLFRRPEDLRVRLAGSEITVGHVDNILSEHRTQTSELATNLLGISSQIGSYGAESFRLHAEARSHLAGVQQGRNGVTAEFPENVLSRDLAVALEEHQVALEHAEHAWSQAEHLCERNYGEAEVMSQIESCGIFERELTAATRLLYTTASQAASDAPGALAEPAQRCVLGLQAAEPQLAAAGAARSALWPRAAQVAERLHWERQVQDGLESFLRDETTRRDLLDNEVKAPSGEAKRAFASMRAVLSSGLSSSTAAAPEEPAGSSGYPASSTAQSQSRTS